jgi:hypothetical protein
MKLPRWLPLFSIILALGGGTLVRATDGPASAAGYWEGAVALPNRELGIMIEITRADGAAWQGTIDIPAQGLRGYKLEPVTVEGNKVSLALPGVPGDPLFTGMVTAGGQQHRGTVFPSRRRVPLQAAAKGEAAQDRGR